MAMEAKGSALVGGAVTRMQDKLMKVKITRAFYHGGKVLAVGDEVELPAYIATERMSYGQCEAVKEEPEAEARGTGSGSAEA